MPVRRGGPFLVCGEVGNKIAIDCPFKKSLPLFLSPVTQGMETFARVINSSDSKVTVFFSIYNDEGESLGSRSLSVEARSVVQFKSGDLSQGDTDLGWTTGLSITDPGFLRLEMGSMDDFSARVYSRTFGSDTNQSSIHSIGQVEEVTRTETGGYLVPVHFFNPASNTTFESQLRLINSNSTAVNVTVSGVDSAGDAGEGNVTFTLQAEESKLITARQLEEGDSPSFTGKLGDGEGKWRLSVQSASPIEVVNLMKTPGRLFTIESDPVEKARNVSLPLFLMPGVEEGVETFVRVINPSGSAATVSVTAFNDEGESFGPLSLSVGARSAVQFGSGDLSQGDTGLGWTTGLSITDPGFLRLELESDQDILARVYSRIPGSDTNQPSLHSLHGVREFTRRSEGYVVSVDFFNPASNTTFESQLRLINSNSTAVNVTLSGVDGSGDTGEGNVTFTLQAEESKLITAQQLEEGDSPSFTGKLGDGEGKWRLSIQSASPIEVMNLMKTPGRLFSMD